VVSILSNFIFRKLVKGCFLVFSQ